MSELLVTADANMIASGILQLPIRPDAAPARFVRAWGEGRFVLVLSEPLLAEIRRTLAKPYFARRLRPESFIALQTFLTSYARIAELAEAVTGIATHPEDDVVLATALSGGAQFVVTGDYKLVSVKQYRGVILLTVSEFLGMLPGLLRRSAPP